MLDGFPWCPRCWKTAKRALGGAMSSTACLLLGCQCNFCLAFPTRLLKHSPSARLLALQARRGAAAACCTACPSGWATSSLRSAGLRWSTSTA